MNCLNCKHWNRLFENPDIGTCEAVDVPLVEAYRFQFEECERWSEGNERQPYYVQGKGFLVTSSQGDRTGAHSGSVGTGKQSATNGIVLGDIWLIDA